MSVLQGKVLHLVTNSNRLLKRLITWSNLINMQPPIRHRCMRPLSLYMVCSDKKVKQEYTIHPTRFFPKDTAAAMPMPKT